MSAFLQAWRDVVTPEWLQQWQAVSSDDAGPTFLIGFPRSGTTLLEQGLDAHPVVSAMEEQPALDRALEHYQRLIQARPAVKLAVAAAPTLAAKLAEILRAMSSLEEHEVAALREHYFAVVNAAITVPAGSLLIDKMPLNLIHLPFILRLFPRARFLVALRDPADCVFSGFMQHFGNNPAMNRLASLQDGAAFYAEVMALLQQYRQVFALEERLHFVRYEELIEDWEGVLRGTLDFIGVGWHPQVQHYREHAQQRGTIATPSYQDVVRPLTKRAAGRWRRYQHLIGEQFAPLQPYRVLWGYAD